jgi:hypothetical protein
MRAILRGIGLIAAMTLSGGAAAEVDAASANYVMPGCRSLINTHKDGAELFKKGLCSGLIVGATAVGHVTKVLCAPNEATVIQLTRVVVQFIDARPKRHHEDFMVLSLEALRTAWPCKR